MRLPGIANQALALRLFPFLRWFPVERRVLVTDLLAGLTVALVIVPKAMAYAQLAGLPPYYGLYAAFIPVIIGVLWGSCSQLATGPVAIISLMTASALAPMALPGSDEFVALAILLALMVGVFQLALGAAKLGALVNFISHPVVIGFTNAAAIIIALSQLSKLLGVHMSRTDHFLRDVWGVLLQIGDIHYPTLLMGLGAIALMVLLKRYWPRAPGVLIAVIITTSLSWLIEFERKTTLSAPQIADTALRELVETHARMDARLSEMKRDYYAHVDGINDLQLHGGDPHEIARLKYEGELLWIDLTKLEDENRARRAELRHMTYAVAPAEDKGLRLYRSGFAPEPYTGGTWHLKSLAGDTLSLSGGGEVVGVIPSGLPELKPPRITWEGFTLLLSSAFVIALVGFMEAVAMSKAIATRTKERINPNQELIGQGLANISGSFTQSYPVCGSFSGSALNLNAGARTGLSSVFNGLFVMVTLLLLTPLLYHLPQSVLAAIIIMAVASLFNFRAIKHAWQTHKHDGAAAVVAFFATILLAPHLDQGILIGAGLAVVLYLLRTMKPRVAVLGRHADGTLRDAKMHHLPTSDQIIAVRFDGSLYFANVPYFEEAILEAVANKPDAKYLLVVGDGINQLDASGEESLRHLVQQLRASGITVVFSGVKMQVVSILQRTGLYAEIGAQHFFRTEDMALDAIYQWLDPQKFDARYCPLRRPSQPQSPPSATELGRF